MTTWRGCGPVPVDFRYSQILCIAFIAGVFFLLNTPQGKAASDTTTLDTVTFSNGDHLSGHFKMATKEVVRFSGTVTGDVSLNWNDIKELDLAGSKVSFVNAQHPSGFDVIAPVIEVSKTDLCITTKTESLQPFPVSQLVSASVLESLTPPTTPKPPENNSYFKAVGGALKVSPDSVVRATQKQIQLAGAFDLGLVTNSEEAFKHQETDIALEANYSDSRKPGGSAVITELYSGLVQQKFYMTDTKHFCEKCRDVAKDGPYF